MLGLPAWLESMLIGHLEVLLVELDCPLELFEQDRERRALTRTIRDASSATLNRKTRSYLDRMCSAAQLPFVEDLLGAGAWGAALRLGDGRVMKLTRDSQEARTCASLVGTTGIHLPDVDLVAELTALGRSTGVFIIVREHVELDTSPLARARAELVCELMTLSRCPALRTTGLAARNLSGHRRAMLDDAVDTALTIEQELHSRGIRFGDFRPENIGLRRGRLCIFDLSLSDGPAVSVPRLELPRFEPPIAQQSTACVE